MLLTNNKLNDIMIVVKNKERIPMPVISRFYGMIVKMYFLPGEHNPPHIHVVYGEYIGIIDVRSCKMLKGDLPPKALKIALEWTTIHSKELLQMWESQEIYELPPIE